MLAWMVWFSGGLSDTLEILRTALISSANAAAQPCLNPNQKLCERCIAYDVGCKQPTFEVQVVRRHQLAQAPKKNTLNMCGGDKARGAQVKASVRPS